MEAGVGVTGDIEGSMIVIKFLKCEFSPTANQLMGADSSAVSYVIF